MIVSFGNKLTELIYLTKKNKQTAKLPPNIHLVARRKLFYLDNAGLLDDLKIPPGNKLEGLRGDLKGFHSIRINDQRRIIFIWKNDGPHEVSICDYH